MEEEKKSLNRVVESFLLIGYQSNSSTKGTREGKPQTVVINECFSFFRVKTIDSEYYWAMNEIFLCVA